MSLRYIFCEIWFILHNVGAWDHKPESLNKFDIDNLTFILNVNLQKMSLKVRNMWGQISIGLFILNLFTLRVCYLKINTNLTTQIAMM
jgi:hypothetical protein